MSSPNSLNQIENPVLNPKLGHDFITNRNSTEIWHLENFGVAFVPSTWTQSHQLYPRLSSGHPILLQKLDHYISPIYDNHMIRFFLNISEAPEPPVLSIKTHPIWSHPPYPSISHLGSSKLLRLGPSAIASPHWHSTQPSASAAEAARKASTARRKSKALSNRKP